MTEVTVNEHIISMQMRWSPQATGQFTSLMLDLIMSAKLISRNVGKAGLADVLGATGTVNVQGEKVQKLDEYANSVMVYRMLASGSVFALGSEEIPEPIFPEDGRPRGQYFIFFDPLDGSSNIDCNVSTGTIFSIFRVNEGVKPGTAEGLLRPGSEQVAAGYFLYGPATMLVYSTGHGVHGFTLDPSVGEFLLSHPDMKIPLKGNYFSVNYGNLHSWTPVTRNAVGTFLKKGYSQRYVGSLVADFHRTLLYGGIFMYPANAARPEGKLRLMYEANPLAFLAEQAGGVAIDDSGMRILDKIPTGVHARTSLIIGSRDDARLWTDAVCEAAE